MTARQALGQREQRKQASKTDEVWDNKDPGEGKSDGIKKKKIRKREGREEKKKRRRRRKPELTSLVLLAVGTSFPLARLDQGGRTVATQSTQYRKGKREREKKKNEGNQYR